MYRIEDKISAVKELQRLLGIPQTGVYDKETEAAVTALQIKYKLGENEKVDYKTFNAIVDEYRQQKMRIWSSDYLFHPSFPYVENDLLYNVELINGLMHFILTDYGYEGLKPSGRFLGKSTLDAADFLRKIFGMRPSREIDEAFVNRLLMEKRAIEIKKQNNR